MNSCIKTISSNTMYNGQLNNNMIMLATYITTLTINFCLNVHNTSYNILKMSIKTQNQTYQI